MPEFFGLDLDRFDGAVDSQFFGVVVELCDFCCPSRCKKAFSSRKGDRSWAKTQPNAFGAPRKLYGRGAADDITLLRSLCRIVTDIILKNVVLTDRAGFT